MFLQIAEVRTERIDEVLPDIVAAEEEWRGATRGRRTGTRERLYVDRDEPGRYLAVNEFSSYEQAMQNSQFSETSALAERVGALVDVPAYWNLDLVLDMRANELEALVGAVVEIFQSGTVDPDLFDEGFILDVNVPEWRYQLQGRSEIEASLREASPDGHNVVSWCTMACEGALVLEVVTRGADAHGGLARQLCVARHDRGRILSMVLYCTGNWDTALEARHAEDAPLTQPGFVWAEAR